MQFNTNRRYISERTYLIVEFLEVVVAELHSPIYCFCVYVQVVNLQ